MSGTDDRSYIDKLFEAFDEDAAQRSIDLARDAVVVAQRKLMIEEATLDAYRKWSTDRSGKTRADATNEGAVVLFTHRPARAQGNGDSLTSRKSILALIAGAAENQEWTIPSVADALGTDAHHAIGVSLSRLARDEKVRRVRKGVYMKLLPETPTGAEGEERETRLRTEASSQDGPGIAGS